MNVKVAVVDSGINPSHPHVGFVAGGVEVTDHGYGPDFVDSVGHGTAVAGAIREKAPNAEIYAVRIFRRSLSAPGAALLRAIDWCIENSMTFVNLSLGTANARYCDEFAFRVTAASHAGITLISALEMGNSPSYPGSLPGVAAVIADTSCPRDTVSVREEGSRSVFVASPYPRPIPGVPVERNLHGISFAVANVTGYLAGRR